MSTFTTIAEMQRLADRELHILFTTVTERLARYDEDTEERRAPFRRVIAQRRTHRPVLCELHGRVRASLRPRQRTSRRAEVNVPRSIEA